MVSSKKVSMCLIFLEILVCVLSFSEVIPNNVGVNIHFLEPQDGVMDMLANLSVTHVRMDFTWAFVEKVKGQYDFSQFDPFFEVMEQYKITPYMIFDYNNQFYDDNLSPYTDVGREAFANFAYACVERYVGRGIIWEVYNEPNGNFWKPKANVDDYCKLAHAVIDRIKPKYPNEIIVGPATSGIDIKFLKEVFDRGLLHGNSSFDYISVHPYGNNPPEKATKKYTELNLLMDTYKGKPKKQVLSGEWGFNDLSTKSVLKQGEFVSRELAVNTMNNIPLSIWYDFHDDGTNKTWTEDHFGLVYNTYYNGRTPCYDLKPGFYAMKTFNDRLKGYTFKKRQLKVVTEWHFVLEYEKNGAKNVWAVWSELDLALVVPGLEPWISVDVGKDQTVDLFGYDNTPMGSLHSGSSGNVDVPSKNGIVYVIPR